MILLSTSDFTGYNYINTSTASLPKLQAYIDRYEKMYILQLLGVELGELFIADLSNASQDVRFVAIQDPFYEQTDAGHIYQSNGMIEFLCAAIAYHYIKDTQFSHTISGVGKKLLEAQKDQSGENAHRYGERRFNEELNTVDAIQWYCKTFDSATYPEYKGVEIKPIYSAIL
jgi:hypothetical protein